MKGVSLAIETIIILILASAVLVTMLTFFNVNVDPTRDIVQSALAVNTACANYMTKAGTCEVSGLDNVDEFNRQLSLNVAKACKLANDKEGKYPSCQYEDDLNIQCLRECCSSYCSV